MTSSAEPSLAALTRGGAALPASVDAQEIAPSIFLSPGVTNSYFVVSQGEGLVINAGSLAEARGKHAERYRRILQPPYKYLLTTQSHRDHIGGVPVFVDAGTPWIASEGSTPWREDVLALAPTYLGRRNRLWSQVLDSTVDLGDRAGPPGYEPDITVGDRASFTVGDERFETLAAPGGETYDSLVVWFPDRRTVFTSNVFGPVFGGLPNLGTLRGDKVRPARQFIRTLDRVLDLEPELLITGHGEPVRGPEIAQTLLRVREAVLYLHDRTVDGMNAGLDLPTLMRTVVLPPALRVPEPHGKASWCVRSIYHEYLGWFQMESTTELYEVPASAVYGDIVAAAGSAALVAAAERHLADGRALHAVHLTELVSAVDPESTAALQVLRAALGRLLEASNNENFSEVMWLRSELTRVDAQLEESVAQ